MQTEENVWFFQLNNIKYSCCFFFPVDNYILSQNYAPQQQNQASTQGVGLRSIAQTGPPNQAPTPPNQDIKVQAVPQSAAMLVSDNFLLIYYL